MISSIYRNIKLKTAIREGFLLLYNVLAMQTVYAANCDLNSHFH
jgi:hypothetical protein